MILLKMLSLGTGGAVVSLLSSTDPVMTSETVVVGELVGLSVISSLTASSTVTEGVSSFVDEVFITGSG